MKLARDGGARNRAQSGAGLVKEWGLGTWFRKGKGAGRGVVDLFYVQGGAQFANLVRDQLGSVRAIFDEAEVRESNTTYTPFGVQTPNVSAESKTTETKGFIGERYDAGAGLQYLNARYYDPELALFIQPDWFEVIEPGVGGNRYSYSFNDPVNKMDPNGNAYSNPNDTDADRAQGIAVGQNPGSTSTSFGDFNNDGLQDKATTTFGENGNVSSIGYSFGFDPAESDPNGGSLVQKSTQSWLKNKVRPIGLVKNKKTGRVESVLTANSRNTAAKTAFATKRGLFRARRSEALNKAKEAWGIPKSTKPDRVVKPNTYEGRLIGLDHRNVRQYEFTNNKGQKISIREDKAVNYGRTDGTGNQVEHFNSGLTGGKLTRHDYFGLLN